MQVNIQYTLNIFCTLRVSHVQNVGQYNVKKRIKMLLHFDSFFHIYNSTKHLGVVGNLVEVMTNYSK